MDLYRPSRCLFALKTVLFAQVVEYVDASCKQFNTVESPKGIKPKSNILWRKNSNNDQNVEFKKKTSQIGITKMFIKSSTYAITNRKKIAF